MNECKMSRSEIAKRSEAMLTEGKTAMLAK